MKKSKKFLQINGLKTPRLFLWILGFIHGLFHTGDFDPQTEMITSGYITGQVRRYQAACAIRLAMAEAKLQELWTEADRLLLSLPGPGTPQRPDHLSGGAQARALEAASRQRASREAQRLDGLKRLSDLSNMILAVLDQAHRQMEATANLLLSAFAAYGHGLLMRPVSARNLPAVGYKSSCIQSILKAHEDTWNALRSAIKEAKRS